MNEAIYLALRTIVERDETVDMNVADALRVLDEAGNGNELDPQFRHFLKNRSYAKAYAYLEEQRSEVEDGPEA